MEEAVSVLKIAIAEGGGGINYAALLIFSMYCRCNNRKSLILIILIINAPGKRKNARDS